MVCTKKNVPKYLHYIDQEILEEHDFLNEELIYRLSKKGNPIEFPSTITAFSCRWSRILKIEDIYNGDHPDHYNDYKYNNVGVIKGFDLIKQRIDGDDFLGWHRLNCRFEHKPTSCDYSHVEINIRHRIYVDNNFDEIAPFYDTTYTYVMWQNGEVLLNRDQSFFKKLRKDYRSEMVKIFCLPN